MWPRTTSRFHHVTFSNHNSLGWFLFVVTVSQIFLVFWWPWQFSGILIRYFLEYPQLGLIWCFSHTKTMIMGFGEEDHRGEVPSSWHHIKGICYWHALQLLMLTLTTSLRESLSGFSAIKLLPPLYKQHPLEWSHYAQTILKGLRVISHLHGV